MKLKTLVESKTAIEGLLKCSLPIDTAWELMKFVKQVNPEIVIFEEIRNKTITEMGNVFLDDRGQKQYRITPDNQNFPEYQKLMNEILDKEIDVVPPCIKIDLLKNYKDVHGKGIEISPIELITLNWLIIE